MPINSNGGGKNRRTSYIKKKRRRKIYYYTTQPTRIRLSEMYFMYTSELYVEFGVYEIRHILSDAGDLGC